MCWGHMCWKGKGSLLTQITEQGRGGCRRCSQQSGYSNFFCVQRYLNFNILASGFETELGVRNTQETVKDPKTPPSEIVTHYMWVGSGNTYEKPRDSSATNSGFGAPFHGWRVTQTGECNTFSKAGNCAGTYLDVLQVFVQHKKNSIPASFLPTLSF